MVIEFFRKYHNFIKENTWGYKIAILVSLGYAFVLGMIVFTMSIKPFFDQMEFNCIIFLAFLTVQFTLTISYFCFKYLRKVIF